MKITKRREAGCTIVELDGTLDDQTSLSEEVGGVLDEGQPRIVLDLSRVKMITSAGLSILVQLNARCNTQGGRMALAAPLPFIQGVFETTKLSRFFEIAPAVADAIRSIST